MGRPSLPVVLVLSILACPLICRGGLCECDGERAPAVHSCCDGCHRAGESTLPDEPSDPRDDNALCGGCICNGAVIENSSLHLLFVDGCCEWSASSPYAVVAEIVTNLHRIATWKSHLPDDDMNPGRALRCRMMSYLC
jgi:hypothetical protein